MRNQTRAQCINAWHVWSGLLTGSTGELGDTKSCDIISRRLGELTMGPTKIPSCPRIYIIARPLIPRLNKKEKEKKLHKIKSFFNFLLCGEFALQAIVFTCWTKHVLVIYQFYFPINKYLLIHVSLPAKIIREILIPQSSNIITYLTRVQVFLHLGLV